MYDELDPKPENDAAIEKVLEELRAGMNLAVLNATRGDAPREAAEPGAVEQGLPEFFGAMSDFDPRWFNEQLAALREMLSIGS